MRQNIPWLLHQSESQPCIHTVLHSAAVSGHSSNLKRTHVFIALAEEVFNLGEDRNSLTWTLHWQRVALCIEGVANPKISQDHFKIFLNFARISLPLTPVQIHLKLLFRRRNDLWLAMQKKNLFNRKNKNCLFFMSWLQCLCSCLAIKSCFWWDAFMTNSRMFISGNSESLTSANFFLKILSLSRPFV